MYIGPSSWGHRVTGSQVKGWAKELAGEDLNFSASDGWLDNFLARNEFSYRRKTNLTALSSEELVNRAVSYMNYLHAAIRCDNFNASQTVLMDEKAVYLEDPRRK